MKTIHLISFFLGMSLQLAFSQTDLPEPQAVFEKYLKAIGGREKLEAVESLRIVQKGKSPGTEYKFDVSIRRDSFMRIFRTSPTDTFEAIICDGGGVNLTHEGSFGMGKAQVKYYMQEASIFPEMRFGISNKSIQSSRISLLPNGQKTVVIEIEDPDGYLEYRSYELETGLLRMILSSNGSRTYFNDYREVDGILFPYYSKTGPQEFWTQEIKVNSKLDNSLFEWNSEKDKSIIGLWRAMADTNSLGQVNYFEFELAEYRFGTEYTGMITKDGTTKPMDFLTQQMVGWRWQTDTLVFNYYNPRAKKLDTRYFIVQDKEPKMMKGYFFDERFDDKEKFVPYIYTFKKMD
ncbi:MAG: hypothetical protein MRZ79_23625 [Bacteroidia bacterium]|nr:hypothetical protein [Bacteroidia bacterium]